MMSPMAPRRTMSKLSNRGASVVKEEESVILVATRTASRFSRSQPRTNHLSGRVILGITHDHDASPTSFDFVAFGNALHRVVGTFGMKIRADFANDGAHIFFRKNDDGVHVGQRRQNFRAFFSR